MANPIDTSFIPQQPILKVEGSSPRLAKLNIPLMIGFTAFFISLALFGGLYFYKTRIDKRIITLEKELESKEESLRIADIERYKDIDSRLKLTRQILKNHIAFSTILDLVEEITAENIGWTSLSYTSVGEDGAVGISLTGEAPSYAAVYIQAEEWRKMSTLRSVEVGMPSLDEATGLVNFSAGLKVDPGYIKYARLLEAKPSAASEDESLTQSP